jgi:hypothetical protein
MSSRARHYFHRLDTSRGGRRPRPVFDSPCASNRAAAPAHRQHGGGQTRRAKTTEAPTIDGILDEKDLQLATPIDSFIQVEPTEGEPGPKTTSALHADVITPALRATTTLKIVTTDPRRDSAMTGQDSFQMIRHAPRQTERLHLRTNPVGSSMMRRSGTKARRCGRPPGTAVAAPPALAAA